MQRISVKEAAALMGATEDFVRVGIRQGVFPWGYAVRVSGDRYTYYINREKFEKAELIK